MKFGLENITKLCEALGHPERAFTSVIVAGTNGKGSVTAMVDAALRSAGHKSARYTSPHLERLEERFAIDGAEIDTDRLEDAAAAVRDAIDTLQRDGTFDSPPTFFETATAIAFVLFRRAAVNIAVLEVGLGGRLDATNVAPAVAAAITSIDFDHQAQLGNTLASIAFEKAGVIKDGIPVVCGPLPIEAERVVRQVCAERGAAFIPAAHRDTVREFVRGAHLSLDGEHQADNAGVALTLLEALDSLGIDVGEDAIRTGLTRVEWPGRLERFTRGACEILLDAAHNPAGARALASYLREHGWIGSVLVFGAMRDKDVAGLLAPLAPLFAHIVCTTAATARAMPAELLADAAGAVAGPGTTIERVDDPQAALARACELGGRVVAAGSIFLIGPLRGILRR